MALTELPALLRDDPALAALAGGSARLVAVSEAPRAFFLAGLARLTGRRPLVVRVGRNPSTPENPVSGPQHAHLGGFDLHAAVAVPAGDRNAVFRALQLRLQREEVLVRFEIRIVFIDRDEHPSAPDSCACASWNRRKASGSVSWSALTCTCVALLRASMTCVKTSRSCCA